jgi:UDP-glucose 6-dehydrogenase
VVGTATGKGFQRIGHEVYFYDISHQRLNTLAREGYRTTRNIFEALSRTRISFICVNTPTNEEKDKAPTQDWSQLISVLYDLSTALNHLHSKNSFESDHRVAERKRQTSLPYRAANPILLVFRSTMLPGTMRNLILQYLETHCSLQIGRDYNVFYNPEFLRQKYALDDFLNVDRVVIGENNVTLAANSSALLQELYKPLTDNIVVTNYETAELIKYAANCFLSLKISYFNEIGFICRRLGIDDEVVNHAVSLDKRIGSYGTHAGKPFDGSCLPKDTKAFAAFVQKTLPLVAHSDLLRSALGINELMTQNIDYKHQERKPFQVSTKSKINYNKIQRNRDVARY